MRLSNVESSFQVFEAIKSSRANFILVDLIMKSPNRGRPSIHPGDRYSTENNVVIDFEVVLSRSYPPTAQMVEQDLK